MAQAHVSIQLRSEILAQTLSFTTIPDKTALKFEVSERLFCIIFSLTVCRCGTGTALAVMT